MASSVTKMGICNIAMGWLRANLITNFDTDTSKEAKLCRANYDRIREAVLEDREWRFATKRMKLALSAHVPEYGYTHKFQIPPDVIRVLACSKGVGRPANVDNNIQWEREEDFVLANIPLIYARCTMNIETTTKFSPGFTQAFATRIAAELAVALTGSNTRHKELLEDYDAKLATGGTRDGMQGKARQRRPGRLQTARYRGGGGFEVLTDV